MGTGWHWASGPKGGEVRGRGGAGWFPFGRESPWSGPWLEHRMAFWREIRVCSLLGESLSYRSSIMGLDEQRQSMVLELYCRKQGEREKGERGGGAWPWREGGKREKEG